MAAEPGVTLAADEANLYAHPSFNAAVRYGVSDHVDVGARIGTRAAEVFWKFVFVGSDPDAFVASVGPVFGAALIPDVGLVVSGQIPVYFGFPIGPHQLVVGPRFSFDLNWNDTGKAYWGWSFDSQTGLVAQPRTSVGGVGAFSLKLAHHVRLHPELVVALPLSSTTNFSDGELVIVHPELMASFHLGFLFGGD